MGIGRVVAEDVEGGVVVAGAAGGGGEVTAPLLRKAERRRKGEVIQEEGEDWEGGGGRRRGGGGSLWMVLVSTAVAVCGSFEFGTCVGYSSPTQSGIVDEVGLSISEFALFGSVLTIGAMIGAVTSGRLADFLGRKMTMRISAIVCIFGWLSLHLAKGVNMLYFGRILLGFSTGVLSYVVPVFISEIAPKHLRGGLATSNQLLICSGCSATYIIGAMVAWRNLVLLGIVPCVLLLTGLLFIPESPRWLANVGREKEFQTSFQMLRGEDADISEEAIEIKVNFCPNSLYMLQINVNGIAQNDNFLQEYIESLHTFPKARVQDLFLSNNIYAVNVGVGLMIFQQLGGINGVGFYASSIFTSAGFSGKLGTILIGIIQIPITLFGAILMDKSGRRVLLMVSASGTFMGCFLTGISFYLKAEGLFPEWVPALALTGILVYVGAYSIGMGPVPWVVMSEIFSIDMKAIGGSLVNLVSWLGSFAISYSFSFLMDWSSAGTFFMFSAASLVTILFVATLHLAPPQPPPATSRSGTAAVAAAQGQVDGAAAPYGGEAEGEGSLWMVFLATAVAVCGSFEFGTCVGYSAPAQAGIVSDFGLSNSEYGVFGSVLAIGAMLGALTSGSLVDNLGRKMVPVFISEIAPKDLRGGLASSNQANTGKVKDFHASLQKLRGENADISEEATGIREYIESLRSLPKAKVQDLFQRKNMYAVIVGVGLMVFQQLGGINALGFYTSYIFSSAGFSGKLGTTLIGIFQIPITLFGALLMDKSGRRALLLVYYAAYSVGMGPVPWVIMSEIFSIEIKAIAGSLVTLVSWIGSFAISYSFSFLMDWNSAGTFFLFSAASFVTVLFVAMEDTRRDPRVAHMTARDGWLDKHATWEFTVLEKYHSMKDVDFVVIMMSILLYMMAQDCLLEQVNDNGSSPTSKHPKDDKTNRGKIVKVVDDPVLKITGVMNNVRNLAYLATNKDITNMSKGMLLLSM
uniref:Major facilitator superfamily (MFS) profile domain-containing protein n=1 Tax=Leersia perrieri TaxID=77586 RepID=A0A0D9VU98_9ORYZ